jgi:alpha,alpha-trehalase
MSVSYTPSIELLRSIHASWALLRRCPLDPAPDSKILNGAVSFLYIPACEAIDHVRRLVERRHDKLCAQGQSQASSLSVHVKYLPDDLTSLSDHDHGLLFLPYDYVVPGGRFNEMYGWDSYWIVKGLLSSGEISLAYGMVQNLLYQVQNYGGKILNANRTYYYSRSQPPLLGETIADLVRYLPLAERKDLLSKAVPALETNCRFWKSERLNHATGLFHYGHPNMGELGLCPEVRMGEVDAETGLSHYDKITAELANRDANDPYRQRFYDPLTNSLTKEALANDRGARESGFDPSAYLGLYGLETLDIEPVCLNTLLCLQFDKLASFYQEVGLPAKSQPWRDESRQLAQRIRKELWNDPDGLFYGMNTRTGRQHAFPFLTSFYPLMAGIATPEQAQRVRDNLPLFEREFGLVSTPEKTGCQWDFPSMWAPLVDFAVQGLFNYGYVEDALRISSKYLKTLDTVYLVTGALYEKYDATTGTHNMDNLTVGYRQNVVGFGWTNGVALRLYEKMNPGSTATKR